MSRVERLQLLARTIPKLGFGSTLAVAVYRARLRLGMIAPDPAADAAPPPRFEEPADRAVWPSGAIEEAHRLSSGQLRGLGELSLPFSDAPDWFLNPLTSVRSEFRESWWKGSDQDAAFGDIKGVWEASRFDWALTLARAARLGDETAVGRLNQLLASWVHDTPAFRTLNWRCGQEAAIRMTQLLLAADILGQINTPSEGLVGFVSTTLGRILPSLSYAIAQNNDHGFSESAGLYIGGTWLLRHARDAEDLRLAQQAARAGRRWLEDRTRKLVFADGGTANYSTNYHRFILDWLCHAELWRRKLDGQAFSSLFYERAIAAATFMETLTNPVSGDAPNLGSNDGARVFRMDDLPYRDFRPSVQVAAVTFLGRRAYGPGPWNEPLAWLGLDASAEAVDGEVAKASGVYAQFGLALIAADDGRSYGFLKAPRADFRPQQADPLHFDLWSRAGENLLSDGGTYSYFEFSDAEEVTGIGGHNTVQFDAREPMRRISRFLYADWIEASPFETEARSVGASYRDWAGASHSRRISVADGVWRIDDEIAGHGTHAVLRWRVAPGEWRVEGDEAISGDLRIRITCDGQVRRFAIRPTYHSPGYAAKKPSLQIEFEVGPEVRRIQSTIRLGEN